MTVSFVRVVVGFAQVFVGYRPVTVEADAANCNLILNLTGAVATVKVGDKAIAGYLCNDGVWPDCRHAGGAVPNAYPLHIDEPALSHWQWLVWRIFARHFVLDRGCTGQLWVVKNTKSACRIHQLARPRHHPQKRLRHLDHNPGHPGVKACP